MEKEPEKLLNDFKERIFNFIGLKLELLKLNAYERVAKIIAILSHSLILLLLAFFTILFIFIALGFFLGGLLNSVALGFLIVAVIYVILLILAFYEKKGIQDAIMNIVIEAIQEKEDEDNDDDDGDKKEDGDRTTDASQTSTSSETGSRKPAEEKTDSPSTTDC